MSNVVIVGIDGSKGLGYEQAIDDAILRTLSVYNPKFDQIGSGEATGVDSAVRRLSIGTGFQFNPFPPDALHKHWNCEGWIVNNIPSPYCPGFKWRNLELVNWGNIFHAVSKKSTIQDCYHCYRVIGASRPHKVNGGCWTMRKAVESGKVGHLVVV